MKEALDVVMAWQLRNPDITNPAEAIEAVKASQTGEHDSELPSRLASQFLQLTIPPFFPQNKSNANTLERSRQPTPWKDSGNQFVLDLLQWSMATLDRKTMESQWRYLMPPILRMIDDIETEWKAKGCHLLHLLLQNMHDPPGQGLSMKPTKSHQTSTDFLQRTGFHNVFADSLRPFFTYIPSLTPERESVTLLQEVFPALLSLAQLLPTDATKANNKQQLLDKVLRDGILAPVDHFHTPSTYPDLATTITSQVPPILTNMGIESVKHLPKLTRVLSAILQDPFALSHTPLLLAALGALQSLIQNAWPRIPAHRGAVMMGLCLLWGRCREDGKDLKDVKGQIQATVAMLDAVMMAAEEEGLKEVWEEEKRDVRGAGEGYGEIFEG